MSESFHPPTSVWCACVSFCPLLRMLLCAAALFVTVVVARQHVRPAGRPFSELAAGAFLSPSSRLLHSAALATNKYPSIFTQSIFIHMEADWPDGD